LAGISPTDPNPGAQFLDVGQRYSTTRTTANQNKASRGLDTLFPGNFETSRVNNTTVDPFIQSIDAEQRGFS